MDGHLGIINSRIDRCRWDVASLEQRLDDLEAANVLLTVKVAAMELRLCRCGREEQPIVVEDGEREESSPSSYQTPPVALPEGADSCEDHDDEGGTAGASCRTGGD